MTFRIPQLREVLDGMSPGPWEAGGKVDHPLTFDEEANVYPPMGESGPVAVTTESEYANARGIAATRNVIGALLDEVEAWREYVPTEEWLDGHCNATDAALDAALPEAVITVPEDAVLSPEVEVEVVADERSD